MIIPPRRGGGVPCLSPLSLIEHTENAASERPKIPLYPERFFGRADCPASRDPFQRRRSLAPNLKLAPAAPPRGYCLAPGESRVGAASVGSAVGAGPRSSGAAAQSPAQIFVPLTIPTSLQPVGASGFVCFSGLPPAFDAAVWATAGDEMPMTVATISKVLIIISPFAFSPAHLAFGEIVAHAQFCRIARTGIE